ncbi:MAG: hypothetical protein K2P81_11975 [Bacteriovoracaceae bacterium]|nr:hypothetical protein [Bacteriovoracaceae bacterium]
MRLISLLALVFCFQAAAFETVRFNYTDFGNDGFSRNYYSCSFAEATLESHLETLGASNISVNCFGGIESWGVSPVSLSATFDVPTATAANHTRANAVKIQSSNRFEQSCFFNTKLLKELVKVFPNVENRSTRQSCFDNSSRWSWDVTVYL